MRARETGTGRNNRRCSDGEDPVHRIRICRGLECKDSLRAHRDPSRGRGKSVLFNYMRQWWVNVTSD